MNCTCGLLRLALQLLPLNDRLFCSYTTKRIIIERPASYEVCGHMIWILLYNES